MKPLNKARVRRRYILTGVFLFLVILLLSCHWGRMTTQGVSPNLLSVLDHALARPFDIFPIQGKYAAIGCMIGLFAPLLLYSDYLQKRDLRPSAEHGSAAWNEDLKGYEKKYVSTPHEGTGSPNMIFAQKMYLSMDTSKTRRNCNVMVLGASGAGKSYGFSRPNLAQANCSFVVTDPSGELLQSMGGFLEKEGYEVLVFNLQDMAHSDCYNPFRYIREEKDVFVMVNTLIRNTTPKGSKPSDPFWERAEAAILEAVCFYIIACLPPEEHNFSTVLRLLRAAQAPEGQPSVLDQLFAALEAEDPENIAVTQYAVYKAAGGGKTAQSILIQAETRLKAFNLKAIRALTDRDTMNLGSVGDRKTAIFCIIPTADTTFNFLVAMMYSQMFETLYYHAETQCENLRLKHRVRFILDEFDNVGTIPDFPQKLATMRKYGISCDIILQALSQIKARYKEDWEVLVANCDSFLFLGAADNTTLDYLSKTMGKETIRTVNNSRSFGRQGSRSTSYNKTGRELMTSTEIREMDNDDCIYLLRGLKPFYARKYDFKSHPNFAACEQSPYDVRQKKFTKGS